MGIVRNSLLLSIGCVKVTPSICCNSDASCCAILLALRAHLSHKSLVKNALNCVAIYRILLANWHACLRAYRPYPTNFSLKITTHSAPINPFLVPPSVRVSIPQAPDTSSIDKPRASAALAIRAPSMCTSKPCECA